MTEAEINALEDACLKGLRMVRRHRPIPPHLNPKFSGDRWIFRSNVSNADWPTSREPYGVEYGDDLEVMLHGGSTARGNLKGSLDWSGVTAYRHHGKILWSTPAERVQLVWSRTPR